MKTIGVSDQLLNIMLKYLAFLKHCYTGCTMVTLLKMHHKKCLW